MRISDWSSDVCSSDLAPFVERLDASGHGVTNGRHRIKREENGKGRQRRQQRTDVSAGKAEERSSGRWVHLNIPPSDFEVDHLGHDEGADAHPAKRSEEHTSELQSLMRISYAVFCLTKKQHNNNKKYTDIE